MPKISVAALEEQSRTGYLEPYRGAVEGRRWRALASALDDFGVNLVTLAPGAASSQRHWHSDEDELVYMLSGEAILIEEGGEIVMQAGEVAVFPKGIPNGHHLVNRSSAECSFLAIGTDRPDRDRCTYPDIDQFWSRATGFVRKSELDPDSIR